MKSSNLPTLRSLFNTKMLTILYTVSIPVGKRRYLLIRREPIFSMLRTPRLRPLNRHHNIAFNTSLDMMRECCTRHTVLFRKLSIEHTPMWQINRNGPIFTCRAFLRYRSVRHDRLTDSLLLALLSNNRRQLQILSLYIAILLIQIDTLAF